MGDTAGRSLKGFAYHACVLRYAPGRGDRSPVRLCSLEEWPSLFSRYRTILSIAVAVAAPVADTVAVANLTSSGRHLDDRSAGISGSHLNSSRQQGVDAPSKARAANG